MVQVSDFVHSAARAAGLDDPTLRVEIDPGLTARRLSLEGAASRLQWQTRRGCNRSRTQQLLHLLRQFRATSNRLLVLKAKSCRCSAG